MMHADNSSDAPAGCLRLDTPGPHGKALGLRQGDILTAINGISFDGTEKQLWARFAHSSRPVRALTFVRDGVPFAVLTDNPSLGRWREVAPEAALLALDKGLPKRRLHPEGMVNWEILRAPGGNYDLHPLRPTWMGLVFPILWLAQMRLWTSLAMLVAVVGLAVPTGWMMAVGVYVLASFYIWRAGPALFRADRSVIGMRPFAIVAAGNEAAARAMAEEMYPDLRFIYTSKNPPEDKSKDGEEAVAG